MFCYNPNEDCPQSLGVSWLETWMEICDNTKRTGGSVFVMYRSDGKGAYSCDDKGPGSLEGQAQPGEILHAKKSGCTIVWVDYTASATGQAIDSASASHHQALLREPAECHMHVALAPVPLITSLRPNVLFVAQQASELEGELVRLAAQHRHLESQRPVVVSDAKYTKVVKDLGRSRVLVWSTIGDDVLSCLGAGYLKASELVEQLPPQVIVLCMRYGAKRVAQDLISRFGDHHDVAVLWIAANAHEPMHKASYVHFHQLYRALVAETVCELLDGLPLERVIVALTGSERLGRDDFKVKEVKAGVLSSKPRLEKLAWTPPDCERHLEKRMPTVCPTNLVRPSESCGKLQWILDLDRDDPDNAGLELSGIDISTFSSVRRQLVARPGAILLTAAAASAAREAVATEGHGSAHVESVAESGDALLLQTLMRCRSIALAACESLLEDNLFSLIFRITSPKDFAICDETGKLTFPNKSHLGSFDNRTEAVLLWVDADAELEPHDIAVLMNTLKKVMKRWKQARLLVTASRASAWAGLSLLETVVLNSTAEGGVLSPAGDIHDALTITPKDAQGKPVEPSRLTADTSALRKQLEEKLFEGRQQPLAGVYVEDDLSWRVHVGLSDICVLHELREFVLLSGEFSTSTAFEPAEAELQSVGLSSSVLERAKSNEECPFWFLRAEHLREGHLTAFVTMQELRRNHPDWLVQHRVTFADGCIKGSLRRTMLAVSHRWERGEHPDPESVQLDALCEYLRAEPEIELVWIGE